MKFRSRKMLYNKVYTTGIVSLGQNIVIARGMPQARPRNNFLKAKKTSKLNVKTKAQLKLMKGKKNQYTF